MFEDKIQWAEFGALTIHSGVIVRGHIVIHSITLVATDAGAASITIYDGENTSAEKKVKITTPANTTEHLTFPLGYPFRRAIYISLGSNVDAVYLTWSYR